MSIKSLLRNFIDIDHKIFFHTELFKITYENNTYIGIIKTPDIGFPHIRIYKNKVSFWNYHCSLRLLEPLYYKYSSCFSLEEMLRPIFRCRLLPYELIIKIDNELRNPFNGLKTTRWEYAVDEWFDYNIGKSIRHQWKQPDYTDINEYTGYLKLGE